MTKRQLQIEELEPRSLLSGMGATVERIEPFAIQFPISVRLCVEGNPVPATASIEAVVSGLVVMTPKGGLHQHHRIDFSRTTIEVAGQEFSIQGHRNFLMNASPSGASNFTNIAHLKVNPEGLAACCSDQPNVVNSLQHQTINANGIITASIGEQPPS